MGFPTASNYQAALQNPEIAFPDAPELARARAENNKAGIPHPYAGNFTATFKLQGDSTWAVRCYTREVRDVAERYKAITKFLATRPDPALTMAQFLPAAILVASQRFDIIQMDWIDGVRLDDAVASAVESDRRRLDALASAFLELGARLENLDIAHGDIQHGNVIVNANGALCLVDYDDMFLPELRHLKFSSGLGQENYQHPGRVSTDYDENLDRFSIISIYITLRALAEKPELWKKYDGGDDNLLFRKADFLDPYASPLFQELDALTPVKEFVDRFASICMGKYDEIPSISDFLDGRFSYSRYTAKAAKLHPSGETASTSSFQPRPMGTPPSIGSEIPPLPGTVAALDRPQSADVPIVSTSHHASARNLPPSAGGIPPSGVGVSPLITTPQWSHSAETPRERSTRGPLHQVFGGVGAAVVLAALFIGFFASHAARPTAAKPSPSADMQPHVATNISHPRAIQVARSSPTLAPPAIATPRAEPPRAPSNGAVEQPQHPKAANPSNEVLPRHSDAGTAQPKPREDVKHVANALLRSQAHPSVATTPACTTPDGPAHLITRATPELSSQTLAEATGKNAVVSVDVGTDGSVRNTSIITASGETRLDLAALSVATRSTYAPAETNCVAAPGSVTLTVNY